MTIEQINEGKKGYFLATEKGAEAGRMIYTWAGDTKFIIEHTEVHPGFEGKGVGKQLLMKAVAVARENDLKIMPLCPFANAMFKKMAAIQDVLF